jgi:hypothetical protein
LRVIFVLDRLAPSTFPKDIWMPKVGRRLNKQAGVATTLEFVILLPFVIFTLFLLFQVALIIQAKVIVNYAAFCAVRSAIVVLPASVKSGATMKTEMAGFMDLKNPSSAKVAIVRRAAALACISISPIGVGPGLSTPPVSGGSGNPMRLSAFEAFGERSRYALAPENTTAEIEINAPQVSSGRNRFVLITVRVSHRYYLVLPFVDRLLGKAYGIHRGFYFPITQEYTLPSGTDPEYPERLKAVLERYEIDPYE